MLNKLKKGNLHLEWGELMNTGMMPYL